MVNCRIEVRRCKMVNGRIPIVGLLLLAGAFNSAMCAGSFKFQRPKTIMHVFDQRVRDVFRSVEHWKSMGYDALQLSPLQKSIGGNQWWTKYQPIDHCEIEGLGSKEELKELCRKCSEQDMLVIGDVVFNHMAVVASRHEWQRAQKDKGYHEELLRRLDDRFKPLDRHDFNPWKDMMDDDWDNENRFEGWGAGEWADLKPTEKVIGRHKKHIDILVECGVRGFRFDAAKHIRPETLRIYVDYIRDVCPEAYIYLEVLSSDPKQHAFFDGWADTTDFGYCFALREAMLSDTAWKDIPLVPLEEDNVHFVRNHDTIMNNDFARSHGFSTKDARLAIAWVQLLAQPSGTALMFPEDEAVSQNGHHPVRAAVQFRKEMQLRGAGPAKVVRVDNSTQGVAEEKHDDNKAARVESKRPVATTSFTLNEDMKDAEELEALAKGAQRPSVKQILLDHAKAMARSDAEELESLAGKTQRQGVKRLLMEQARILRKGGDRQAEGPGPTIQRMISNALSPLKKEGHGEKRKKEVDGIVAVLRGRHGAALCNMGKWWCDVALVERAIEGTLSGRYKELVYGFEVEFDQGRIVSWAGHPRGPKVQFGPESSLLFLSLDKVDAVQDAAQKKEQGDAVQDAAQKKEQGDAVQDAAHKKEQGVVRELKL